MGRNYCIFFVGMLKAPFVVLRADLTGVIVILCFPVEVF